MQWHRRRGRLREVRARLWEGFIDWLDHIADVGLVRYCYRGLRSLHAHLLGPRIDGILVADEILVDQVPRHWVYRWKGWGINTLAVVVILAAPVQTTVAPVACLSVGLALAVWGVLTLQDVTRDVLLISNSRVIRVWGVLETRQAWMPLNRVLDIAIERPWHLRPLRVGHMIIENAAQTQGIREVRGISRPERRARTIHLLKDKRVEEQLAGLGPAEREAAVDNLRAGRLPLDPGPEPRRRRRSPRDWAPTDDAAPSAVDETSSTDGGAADEDDWLADWADPPVPAGAGTGWSAEPRVRRTRRARNDL